MDVKNVVDTILGTCKTPPIENTCDQLIAGDWHNQVTGIATTFMATIDVIRESIRKGTNLIITHEPTFFTSHDKINWLATDPVYLEKIKLIQEHQLNIWRFHDHMHSTKPDLIYTGVVQALGWEKYSLTVDSDKISLPKKMIMPLGQHCFSIPETSVEALTEFLKHQLNVKGARIVGNVRMPVERVLVLVGGSSLGFGIDEMPMVLMRDLDFDVIVCGEILEWTLPAYVRDAAQLGMNKALIILGHNRTEEAGMAYLHIWLENILPNIPIHFIEAGEPFEYL